MLVDVEGSFKLYNIGVRKSKKASYGTTRILNEN